MTGEKSGEFRGKTVDAAVMAGLAALNLSRDQVQIEVLRPGSRGVLGIGAEDAVVRLTSLKPAQPESKPQPKAEAVTRVERQVAPHAEPVAPAKVEAWQEQSAATVPDVSGAAVAPKDSVEAASSDAIPADVEMGRDFLTELLTRMNLRAAVEIVPQSEAETGDDEQVMVLNVVGDDLEVLIGRQNEVLSAMEFITRLAVNQQSRSRSNLIVDINGYRAKRAESLRKLSLRMAEQAIQAGRTMMLEPMTPAERRIVHLTLRDHPAVTTQSVGEGDRRKVTIIPKKG